MIKNILFDMDGVLLKSHEAHNAAWTKAFDEFGVHSTEKEMNLIEGATSDEFIDYFLTTRGLRSNKTVRNRILKRKREIFYSEYEHKPYKILKYLRELKEKGIKMAIYTGASRGLAEELTHTFFKGIFTSVTTGDDVTHGKPDPEGYNHALRSLKGKKKETIIVENAPYGIEAGIKARIPVYALETTLNREELSHATQIFKNHKELFSAILEEIHKQ